MEEESEDEDVTDEEIYDELGDYDLFQYLDE